MKRDVLMRMQQELRPEGWLGVMSAVVGMTLLAGYLYLLKPALKEHGELLGKSSPEEIQAAIGGANDTRQEIARLETEVESLNEKLWGRSSEESADTLESFIIDHLDRASDRHAVHLESVKPGAINQVLIFDELHYDVVVQGDYFDLYTWLAALEKDLRPLVVKSFEVASESRDSDRLKMELRLVSYRPRSEA